MILHGCHSQRGETRWSLQLNGRSGVKKHLCDEKMPLLDRIMQGSPPTDVLCFNISSCQHKKTHSLVVARICGAVQRSLLLIVRGPHVGTRFKEQPDCVSKLTRLQCVQLLLMAVSSEVQGRPSAIIGRGQRHLLRQHVLQNIRVTVLSCYVQRSRVCNVHSAPISVTMAEQNLDHFNTADLGRHVQSCLLHVISCIRIGLGHKQFQGEFRLLLCAGNVERCDVAYGLAIWTATSSQNLSSQLHVPSTNSQVEHRVTFLINSSAKISLIQHRSS
mmetsp:Transcript_44425/g.117901  ORF Transcript_44425/g.117901 Transcript_44425/m.117901 type:complete len:274 (-) Transcript_44425:135-956(-)